MINCYRFSINHYLAFMKRSQFISSMGLSLALLPATPLFASTRLIQDRPPQLDKNLVEKFVNISHSKFDEVKVMLEEHPNLLNAAHDWSGGDFETGLGAASHVGHKEMTRYFLEKGAQANVFTAALFGRMDIVKSMIELSPAVLQARGPHGFSLLHHAEKGGDEALELKDYLLYKGLKTTRTC